MALSTLYNHTSYSKAPTAASQPDYREPVSRSDSTETLQINQKTHKASGTDPSPPSTMYTSASSMNMFTRNIRPAYVSFHPDLDIPDISLCIALRFHKAAPCSGTQREISRPHSSFPHIPHMPRLTLQRRTGKRRHRGPTPNLPPHITRRR